MKSGWKSSIEATKYGSVDVLKRCSKSLGEGACAGEVVMLDDMLEEYYARRGWTGGVPDREKREELGPA